MKKNYSVPLGIILVFSITYICTSYVPFLEFTTTDHLEPGQYELTAQGSMLLNLQGTAVFDTRESFSKNGNSYKNLELQLTNQLTSGGHCITIYMADPEFHLPLKKKSYLISENIKGFIDQFEGVFGIADIAPYGELPYFTRNGKITILKADNESMAGRLMLVLRNASGELIELEGNFIASHNVSN